MNIEPTPVRIRRKELIIVLILWLVLVGTASVCLLGLRWNSFRIINHIEYVAAGRWVRMLVLYEEARKNAARVFAEADKLPAKRVSPEFEYYKEAVNLYKRAFAIDPRGEFVAENAQHHQVLMRLHESAGNESACYQAMAKDAICRKDNRTATDYLTRMTEKFPNEMGTWSLMAEVALRNSDVVGAESSIQRLGAVGAPVALVHEMKGRLALLKSDLPKAISEYQTAVSAQPDNVDYRKTLARLLANQSKEDERLKVLVEGETRGGNRDGNYMHTFGEALLGAKRAQEAVNVLTTAAKLEPHSADVHWSLARAHSLAGNQRRAEQSMRRAFEINPALRSKTLDMKQ